MAHTVLEELALYLIFSEAESFADMDPTLFGHEDDWREWLVEILGDLDVEFLLFNPSLALTPDFSYHFDHWDERQFYTDEAEVPRSGVSPKQPTVGPSGLIEDLGHQPVDTSPQM